MNDKIISFQKHGDSRGMLVSLENGKEIPFEIKRVYYLFDTLPNVRRGFHAHKELKQILICVNGSCKIHLDDGFETKEIVLDSPCKGLYIESDIWREMYDFSDGSVLVVLASEIYDEADYIRNYDKFFEYVRSKQ